MKCNCSNSCGRITGLAHIGVYTANMEESIRFYTEVLGLELVYTKDMVKPDGVTKLAFVQVGGCTIELIEPSDPSFIAQRTNGIVDHIALEVKNLEELVCRLRESDIPFETENVIKMPALFNGAQAIFCKGPNGERLEFFEYIV